MNERRISLSRKGNHFINKKIIQQGNNEQNQADLKESENNFESMGINYGLFDSYEDDESKYEISVGFIIVATNKYDVFVEPLIRSIEKYVLPNNKKYYNIFSDKDISIEGTESKTFKIEHKPFPYPTLKRFHFFNRYRNEIIGDQLVYIDADTLVTDNIGTEIITPITVTQHCGFINRVGSFERRPLSKCCVPVNESKNYYGGGFYSFDREEFFKMSDFCMNAIDADESIGLVPIWHDESAMNKYITTLVPTRVLSPSYHYPQNHESIYKSWGERGKETFNCKILLLEKNHNEIREL